MVNIILEKDQLTKIILTMKMTYTRSETIELANNEIITFQLKVEDKPILNSNLREDEEACHRRLSSFVKSKIDEDMAPILRELISNKMKDLVTNKTITKYYRHKNVMAGFALLASFNVENVSQLRDDQLRSFYNELKSL